MSCYLLVVYLESYGNVRDVLWCRYYLVIQCVAQQTAQIQQHKVLVLVHWKALISVISLKKSALTLIGHPGKFPVDLFCVCLWLFIHLQYIILSVPSILSSSKNKCMQCYLLHKETQIDICNLCMVCQKWNIQNLRVWKCWSVVLGEENWYEAFTELRLMAF